MSKTIIIVNEKTLKPYKVELASVVIDGCVIQSKVEFTIVDPLTDEYVDYITIDGLNNYSFTKEVAIELMKLIDREVPSKNRKSTELNGSQRTSKEKEEV